MTARDVAARIAYAALFVFAVPALLALWARAAEPLVPLPPWHAPSLGLAVLGAGLALVAWSMVELRVRGGGLPMNAFPPSRLVRSGPYRWIGHPIYVGFATACFGASIATGSAAGLWLVSPVASLACAALVWGYERRDLEERFGRDALRKPFLSLPPPGPGRPTAGEAAAIVATVLVPWLILYEAVHALGAPPDAFSTRLAFENAVPVLPWTYAIYASAYLVVPLAPFLARDRATARRFAIAGILATAGITLFYLCVPAVTPFVPFVARSLFGRWLAAEQAFEGNAVAALPAFHVVWAILAAEAIASGRRRMRPWVGAWTVAVALSCVTTGMHGVVDVAAAIPAVLLVRRGAATWMRWRAAAERIANSWREWRIGRVRVINHGLYAGLGAGAGVGIVAAFAGAENLVAVAIVAVAGLLGAGLWAQWVEGSPLLLRPFGYYGGVVGAAALTLLLEAVRHRNPLPLLAAFAVGGPWIQAVGRLRCLVQGCCHGFPCAPHVGIRYRHPRSRVVRLAGWKDVPLHATPVYSILANVATGCLLLRLAILGAAPGVVAGLYFVLNGLARFVEEGYRGEPQTRAMWGLRLYQWLAVLSVVAGAWITTIRSPGFPETSPPAGAAAAFAVAFGAIVALAMGVDWPDSERRFSRLA